MKIGVFDSGIGGITVLTELRRHLPRARFVYLGDTAHVPYGTRSPEQVRRLSRDCARQFKIKKVDALVVACNTASSLALDTIQNTLGKTPVFGVLEPGAQAVVDVVSRLPKKFKKQALAHPLVPLAILVLATRATVRSGAYGRLLQEALKPMFSKSGGSFSIIEQPCPLLVPMIEEGWVDHPILHQTIAEYTAPYAKHKTAGIALLACTHYPWIRSAFQKALPGWILVDSAHGVAKRLTQCLRLKKNNSRFQKIEWIFTDPNAVPAFALEMIHESS